MTNAIKSQTGQAIHSKYESEGITSHNHRSLCLRGWWLSLEQRVNNGHRGDSNAFAWFRLAKSRIQFHYLPCVLEQYMMRLPFNAQSLINKCRKNINYNSHFISDWISFKTNPQRLNHYLSAWWETACSSSLSRHIRAAPKWVLT